MAKSKKTIKICALFGSPRRDGFSSRLHSAFLSCFDGCCVEKFFINQLSVSPCSGCLVCRDGVKCPLDDDMQRIYKAVQEADLITFSFPLYFSSIPGPMKNVIDRCNLLWQRKQLGLYPASGQKGMIFSAAGSQYRDMFKPSMTVISHLMNSIGGSLDRDLSLCVSGTDSEEGKKRYEQLLFSPQTFSGIIGAIKKI